jgi:hypothetical protein
VGLQRARKQRRILIRIDWRQLLALATVWALSVTGAEVAPIQVEQIEQAVFGGGSSRIQTIFRNPGEQPVKLTLRSRLYQASASTLAPLEESKPLRTITVEPGQAVIETVAIKLPAVRTETTFILRWQSEDRKLGRTVIHAFPTNLLERLFVLNKAQSLGLFDPEGNFGGAFPTNTTRPLRNVDDLGSFDGSLLIVAPAQNQETRATVETIVSCAKRGAGVIWIQPPTAQEVSSLPASYVVNVGEGHVVIAHASTVTNLAQSPTAQLTMIRLAELATGRRKLDLPNHPAGRKEEL